MWPCGPSRGWNRSMADRTAMLHAEGQRILGAQVDARRLGVADRLGPSGPDAPCVAQVPVHDVGSIIGPPLDDRI